jgi:cytochrome c5
MDRKAKAAACLLAGALMSAGCAAGASKEEGKKLTEDICTRCHSIDVVENHDDDESGWKEIIAQMRDHGARITEDEEAAIIEYLANK